MQKDSARTHKSESQSERERENEKGGAGRKRNTHTQTDRRTDRHREREGMRESVSERLSERVREWETEERARESTRNRPCAHTRESEREREREKGHTCTMGKKMLGMSVCVYEKAREKRASEREENRSTRDRACVTCQGVLSASAKGHELGIEHLLRFAKRIHSFRKTTRRHPLYISDAIPLVLHVHVHTRAGNSNQCKSAHD